MSKFHAIVKIELPVYCEFDCPDWQKLTINDIMSLAKSTAKNKIAPQDLRDVYLKGKTPAKLYEDGKTVVWSES